MASSLVTIQDGSAAAVAVGSGQNVTPGNTVTVALTDSTFVTAWFLRVIWTNGTVNEFNFTTTSLTVNQSPNWNATFTAPAEGTGFVFYSEVIASSGTPAPTKFGIYCAGAGDAKLTFPTDPLQLIQALTNPRFTPASELAAGAGAVSPKVQCVVTSLPTYTGSGTGVLTATATGAIGAQDGQTLTAGQLVHLATGTTNLTAADAGPYVVTNPGGTGVKYVLTRPGWFPQGATAQQGMTFDVLAGTLYGGSTWKATAAASVIGTTDAAFYPKVLTRNITLVAGTLAAITNMPVLSATTTAISFQRTAVSGTLTTFSMYTVVPAPTAGPIGTASIVPMSVVAAGTILNTDTCTLVMTVTNPL